MSKGFGRVQREIDALFRENPDNSFTIEEICRHVYGDLSSPGDWQGGTQKRHRVAVLRAAKSVAKQHPNIETWYAENRGGTLIFFNHRSLMSYATARLKSQEVGGPLSDTSAHRRLRENEYYSPLMKEGGHWWRHVQEWIAERDNNADLKEKLKPLQEAAERESAAQLAMLRAYMKG